MRGGQVLQDTAHDAKTELYQKEDIAVSVYCLVYNHEKYLRDALEGFVKQKTTFKYEVFVHDDASTDGSAEIIKEYATKYPNIIKPIFQKQNQYSQKVKIVKTFIYPHISGKYIAACEGDDYWTDEYKLQYQYEVMEAHPECSICSHYARVVEMDNKALVRFSPDKRYNACEGVMDKELQMDISMNDMFQLSSDFMRRSVYDKYTENRPEFANKMLVGDTPLLLFFAKYGSLYFIDREMSVYRRGTEGSWTKRNLWKAETRIRHVDASIEGLIACKEFFEGEYSEMFDEAVYNLKINSAVLQKNYKSAFKDIPYLIRKGRKILAMKIVVCSISPKLEIVWDKFKKFK